MRRFVLLLVFLSNCAAPGFYRSLPPIDDLTFVAKLTEAIQADEPSVSHPKVGCIVSTLDQESHVAGKLLPEIVRVIGTYEHNSDEWMVLRSGERNPAKWVPIPKSDVRFINCGESDASRIFARTSAERSTPPRR